MVVVLSIFHQGLHVSLIKYIIYVCKCERCYGSGYQNLGPGTWAKQIRVNIVAPGAVGTDFNGGTVRDNEKVNEVVAGLTALGRAGVPDDIGGVIAFLCTEDARWINGQRIEVSGGNASVKEFESKNIRIK